ncbi:hypothetical protein D3C87_1882440 [compost metagenome]
MSTSALPEFQICAMSVPRKPTPSERYLEKFSLIVSVCVLSQAGSQAALEVVI